MAFVTGFGPAAASAFTGQRVGAAATCPPTAAGAVASRRAAGAAGAQAVISTPRPASTTVGVKVATPMTLTEKILAKAAHKGSVRPGDNIWVNTDVLMTHDVCGPGTIGVFKREFGEHAKVWDTEKVVIIPDHYIFTEDVRANRNVDILRDFVNEQGIKYFYDITDRSDYKAVCFACWLLVTPFWCFSSCFSLVISCVLPFAGLCLLWLFVSVLCAQSRCWLQYIGRLFFSAHGYFLTVPFAGYPEHWVSFAHGHTLSLRSPLCIFLFFSFSCCRTPTIRASATLRWPRRATPALARCCLAPTPTPAMLARLASLPLALATRTRVL